MNSTKPNAGYYIWPLTASFLHNGLNLWAKIMPGMWYIKQESMKRLSFAKYQIYHSKQHAFVTIKTQLRPRPYEDEVKVLKKSLVLLFGIDQIYSIIHSSSLSILYTTCLWWK